jgi:hypothetical protein
MIERLNYKDNIKLAFTEIWSQYVNRIQATQNMGQL